MNPYTDVDFSAAWKALQETRRRPDSSEFWDGRAASFDHKKKSPYSGRFIELLDLRAGESVFDMGCGTGIIAIDLARAGHPALCADFSPKMIEILNEKAAAVEQEIGHPLPLEARVASWNDDWAAVGIEPKSVDVAYASRSMAVADLGEAIDKLSAVARRRCAATVSTNGSPRCCDAILEAAGRPAFARFDTAFFVDILWQKGYFPQIAYIEYGKERDYASIEDVVDDAADRLGDPTAKERALLAAYVHEHARRRLDGRWTVDEFNTVQWAFVAWDV